MNIPAPTPEALGDRVRRKRREASLTTLRLAELAGCNQSTIIQIENDGNPTWGTMRAVAHALGMTVTELVYGVRGDSPDPIPAAEAASQGSAS